MVVDIGSSGRKDQASDEQVDYANAWSWSGRL